MRTCFLALTLTAVALALVDSTHAADRIDCHARITPNIVSDKLSKQNQGDIDCAACHDTQVQQFKRVKYAMARRP